MPSLGEDLSDLRKKENLTLKNIFDSTRIPIYILKSIEDSSVFKDPKQNKTYVRSFVRTYAKALKIEESDIVKALDQTYKDKYDGLIANKYRLKKSDTKEKDSETQKSQDYHPKFSLDTPQEAAEKAEQEDSGKESEEKEEKNELYNPETIKTPTGSDTEFTHPDPSKPHNKQMPEPPTVHNVNWAAMNNKITDFRTKTPMAIIAAIIVILLAAGTFFIYTHYWSGETSTKQSRTLQSLPADTLSNQATSVTSDSVKAAAGKDTTAQISALPDTLKLVVYAAYKKLEPVRVKSDLANKLNPYWIEKGSAMRFRFLNNISIRGQYNRMMILFHGHPIPNIKQYMQNDGTLLLQRALFEKHKDWWKPSDGGPLPNDVPWPSVIHNTPIY